MNSASSIEPKDYCAIARGYCEDVVAGKILACRWVKLSCERQLNNLAKQSDPEYPYYFDDETANKVCRFAEKLPHVTGRAFFRKRLRLEPWQCFVVTAIYGWLRRSDNLRRFRTALIFVPKKNGKTFLSAITGIWGLRFDHEPGAEVLVGATNERQANLLFSAAQRIVLNSPGLRRSGLQTLAHAIVHPASGSRMETVIGQPKDGQNGSTLCLDEAHEWPNDLLLTALQSGTVTRLQPLTVITTTAGYNLASPAKFLLDDLHSILEGTSVNEETFGVNYTIDPGDDWRSETALIKANPNYGVSIREDNLQSEQLKATQSPRLQSTFRTKHLNVWVNVATSWLDMDRWNECGDPSLSIDDFEGQPCWAGLDGASKLDLTAYVLLFMREIESKRHYYLFPRFYLPAAQVDKSENSHYRQWSINEHLHTVPGEVDDHEQLKEQILADAKRFEIWHFAYDPFGVHKLTSTLAESGLRMVETEQKWHFQSVPMKELEALVSDRCLHHPSNPVMTWCVANTKVNYGKNNIITPSKENASSPKKIDGTVATIMALRPAMLASLAPARKRFTSFSV